MNDFVITATRSMRNYASRVVDYVAKLPCFSAQAETINGVDILQTLLFADGELEVEVSKSVRGKDVVIFSSSCRNEAGIEVNQSKIELYHTVDALKRSQAGRVIVFEPYISSSRSDRKTRRNSVGLWVHFKTLTVLGVKHIVTYQLHSNKSESMLDPTICTIDDVPVLKLLERYLCDVYIRDIDTLYNEVRPNWAFCSVDSGGVSLAKSFANAFMTPLVVAHKQRDYSKINTIESLNILSAEPIEGKTIWIVDDMIDTAGSIERLIRALGAQKPKEINIIAVHAILSPPATERLAGLAKDGLLKRIIVADTADSSGFTGISHLIEVVPSTELSARIIRTMISNESMGKLLNPFNAENYLKSPGLFSS